MSSPNFNGHIIIDTGSGKKDSGYWGTLESSYHPREISYQLSAISFLPTAFFSLLLATCYSL